MVINLLEMLGDITAVKDMKLYKYESFFSSFKSIWSNDTNNIASSKQCVEDIKCRKYKICDHKHVPTLIIYMSYARAVLYAENSHVTNSFMFEGGLRIWNAETKSIFLRSEEKGIPGMHYCSIYW